jgi:hypothetical protein
MALPTKDDASIAATRAASHKITATLADYALTADDAAALSQRRFLWGRIVSGVTSSRS